MVRTENLGRFGRRLRVVLSLVLKWKFSEE